MVPTEINDEMLNTDMNLRRPGDTDMEFCEQPSAIKTSPILSCLTSVPFSLVKREPRSDDIGTCTFHSEEP